MPKPRKGEIYGTFNNEMCYERAMEKLRKIEDISINPLDSYTVKIILKKKDAELEKAVNYAITSSKGYVEIDLDVINAVKSGKGKKVKSDTSVLDTPFYG
ncbi:MAG: hypothetical protein ACYC7D_10700 [Nitrososphaerales archaeon]